MVSLKIQKRSVLVLILTLILFSGNTIIIGYVTPLLYLVGFFSFIWGDRKQIRSNKYTSRIIGIYLAWLLFLIINTVQSYDFSASKSMIPVFIIGGVFCLFSWKETTVYTYINMIRFFCLFFAVSILVEVIAPNFILAVSNVIAPGRSSVIQDEISRGIYSGLTGEKAKAAYAMVIGICAELSFFVFNDKKLNKSNYLLILLYFLATMLTSKRMLCVIILLEIGVALKLFDFKGKSVKIILGGAIALVAVFVITITIPQTSNIVDRFMEASEDTSAGGRLMFWNYCIEMFKDKPIIGYGINTFNKAFSDNVGYVYQGSRWNMYAHSMYYELLGETGIVGIVLFGFFMLYSLVYSLRLFRNSCLSNVWKGLLWFSISLQILFIVYGYSGNVLYDKAQLFTYLSSISMLIAVSYHAFNETEILI